MDAGGFCISVGSVIPICVPSVIEFDDLAQTIRVIRAFACDVMERIIQLGCRRGVCGNGIRKIKMIPVAVSCHVSVIAISGLEHFRP